MKTCLLSIFLLYGVNSLEAPLGGDDEEARRLTIIINITTIIDIVIVIINIMTIIKIMFVLILLSLIG